MLKTEEVATILCVSSKTVIQWIRKNKLPAYQFTEGGHYMIKQEDLDAFIENSKTNS